MNTGKEMKTVTVKFGSAEYFKLLTDKPELKDVLALGTKVTVGSRLCLRMAQPWW